MTIPHKEKIIEFLDIVDGTARKIGAVNTIVNKNGKLAGYNTDVIGVMNALKTGVRSFRGKKAAVLGAGGASRAIVYGLKKAGADVWVFNRDVARAKRLAARFHAKYGPLASCYPANFDIIINATSVGMKPNVNATPLPNLTRSLKGKTKKPVVMDVVYGPLMTKLLRAAAKAGCKIIKGDKMFYEQAAAAFRLWTGKKFPTTFPKIPTL